MRFLAPVVLALALAGCAGRLPRTVRADDLLQDALRAVGLTSEDLTIRGDYLPDPDRLAVTGQILSNPLAGEAVADAIGAQLTWPSAEAALAVGCRYLALYPQLPAEAHTEAVVDLQMPGLSEPLAEILTPLVAELVRCHRSVEAERSRFSPEERTWLYGLVNLVDPECRVSERKADALLALARRVDRQALAAVAGRLLSARERFLEGVKRLPPAALHVSGGTVLTPAGPVVIGGVGDDVYREAAALIVDFGGNDRYETAPGTASEAFPVSLAVDMTGADVYLAGGGSGVLGVGILVDVSGEDRYDGAAGSLGCGVAGVGILEDAEGRDRYRAGLGSLGFGLYGIGALCDGAGSDAYDGDLLVQGAAGPGGVGILCDHEGDDVYQAGGRYRDFREAGAYFQSMAQGFSLGIRPAASGGVGILCDRKGNDRYRIAYFGQGAAYWAGSGVLIDFEGNDHYVSRRYAQGCGVHLSAGVLLEAGGDDRYTLWGVGQGCGHDLSVGMLIDRGGNDRYRAGWLAQGAGNANGIGLMDDREGDDQYVGERDDTQGYGNPSRDYGSIGLFIDRKGRDDYSGPGGEGRFWVGGTCGAGVDGPIIRDGE